MIVIPIMHVVYAQLPLLNSRGYLWKGSIGFYPRSRLAYNYMVFMAVESSLRIAYIITMVNVSGGMEDSLVPYLALNACAVLWGTQHAIIKQLVVTSSVPLLVNAIRFSTASIVTSAASCLLGKCRGRRAESSGYCGLLVGAAELAVWQTLGFTLQLIGLQWTTASRSAFLLYLNAPLVQLMALLLGERDDIGLRTWVCVAVAVTGTLMLVNDGAAPNLGDLWSLCAALASAVYITRVGRAGFMSLHIKTNPKNRGSWTGKVMKFLVLNLNPKNLYPLKLSRYVNGKKEAGKILCMDGKMPLMRVDGPRSSFSCASPRVSPCVRGAVRPRLSSFVGGSRSSDSRAVAQPAPSAAPFRPAPWLRTSDAVHDSANLSAAQARTPHRASIIASIRPALWLGPALASRRARAS